MSRDRQAALPFATRKDAPLDREGVAAILNALCAACWSKDAGDAPPKPCPVEVVRLRNGNVRVSWRGGLADGRTEHEAMGALLRRECAGARAFADGRRREARRLREAAAKAPELDAHAARIEAALARLADSIPAEPLLDGFDDPEGDAEPGASSAPRIDPQQENQQP